MAYELLAQMRIDLFDKLVALGPAYLMRRRSGDLVAPMVNALQRGPREGGAEAVGAS